MNKKRLLSNSLPVPEGRLARASSFGKIAMKFASSVVFDGTKELISGHSPSLKNLLIQEKNILTFIEELTKLRGAALKIGQLLSALFMSSSALRHTSLTAGRLFFVPFVAWSEEAALFSLSTIQSRSSSSLYSSLSYNQRSRIMLLLR